MPGAHAPAEPEHLVVGHIAKAHGTQGELFVWPLTDRPGEVFVPGRALILGDEGGRVDEEAGSLVVEETRPFKRGVLVRFEGFEDRNQVEPYTRRYLLLPASELAPLEEGEVYYHQLLGLEVVTVEGERVGRVREVFETEPAHLLEVKAEGGKVHLVPFTERIVTQIDLEGGRIVIAPPPGLLEI